MHPAQIGKRRLRALESVTLSTGRLADFVGIDKIEVERIATMRNSDPQVTALWRLEQIAKVLESIVANLGQEPSREYPNWDDIPGMSQKSLKAIESWANGGG